MSHPKVLSAPTLLCTLLLAGLEPSAAAEPGPAITDPGKGGIDYELQGEYKGPVDIDGQEVIFGLHVVALGEGKFRLVAYPSGLPGDGWHEERQRIVGDGELSNGKLMAVIEGATLEIADGTVNVTGEGQTIGMLKKEHRESPASGAQPPDNAVVLFAGESADAFENGKLVDGKFLAATGAASKHKFGDHRLHLEFRTPFMPRSRGQARGNSGVYVQGRYEVQILDSFGLEGKDNECGGIYSVAPPAVNMCLPPLAWQTYDIDFTAARYNDAGEKTENARITVRHNGVVIHDDVELPTATPGYQDEGPEDAPLFLQDHGNPVVFRNIWVVEN